MKNKLFVLFFFLFVGLFSSLHAQTIKGTVYDENNDPLMGVSVFIKGTSVGTATDLEGAFSLIVPEGTKMISFSYIGYETMQEKVSSDMKVHMSPLATNLDEVVVTGLTRTDKRLFTGSADKLDASKILLDGVTDISRSLEGRSSGVSVQNVSGTFGTAPKIRVRGATSIFGNSKPLWVVDGVIMEDVSEVDTDKLSSGDAETLISSAIAGLNAEDIESFDILKDGSATSVYGARAMAGVIVITTKKGKSGVSRISYTGEFTYRMKPRYSEFNITNSQEQMGIYQELEQKGWLNLAEISNKSSSGVYGKMYQLINSGELTNTEYAKNQYLREAEYRNTDWFDELFNNNVMNKHTISLTSGTDKSTYYASISTLQDAGWTKQSSVKLYTGNLNATYNISDNLSFNMITNASFREQKAPGTLGSEIDPVNGTVKRDFDINPYSYALNTSRALDKNTLYTRSYAPFNILHELQNNYIDLNVNDIRIQGMLNWKPILGLNLSVLGAARTSSNSQENHIKDNSNQAESYRMMPTTIIRDKNPLLYTDPDNPYAVPITILPEGGIYKRTDKRLIAYDFRATANYNKIFEDTHIINFDAGMEYNTAKRRETWFRGWGMQYSLGEIPFYAYEVFKKGKEDGSDYYGLANYTTNSLAYYGVATYSYKSKYTLNGTFRYEGTNRLGKSRSARWLPTWNIGAAWNVYEEDFFKSLKPVFSFMSIKPSYSLVGDRGPAFVTNSRAVIQSYNPWRPSANATESGTQISYLENSELTYEKKHEFNLGVEMGFLENKINTEFAWYTRNNYDLIGYINTQGVGGESLKYGNVAEMKSHGIELSITTRNIDINDFSWSTNFIYSYTKNEINKLKSRKRAIDLVSGVGFAAEGYPNRSLFSYQFAGLSEDGFPQTVNEQGEITVTDINFQERDNLGHLVYSGSIDPTNFGSIGNTFNYKNFNLNIFITYSWGNVVRLDPVFDSEYSDLDAMPKEFKNRWVVPGDEERTNIPVIASTRQVKNNSKLSYAYNAYNYSTARIAKGDFVRLKEISLNYNFPKSTIKDLKLSSLSLRVQATNLFLIYADKKLNGQDPEFFNTGGVASPVPRQFTMTLRLGL